MASAPPDTEEPFNDNRSALPVRPALPYSSAVSASRDSCPLAPPFTVSWTPNRPRLEASKVTSPNPLTDCGMSPERREIHALLVASEMTCPPVAARSEKLTGDAPAPITVGRSAMDQLLVPGIASPAGFQYTAS